MHQYTYDWLDRSESDPIYDPRTQMCNIQIYAYSCLTERRMLLAFGS